MKEGITLSKNIGAKAKLMGRVKSIKHHQNMVLVEVGESYDAMRMRARLRKLPEVPTYDLPFEFTFTF
jgi:hypothetical protein